MEFDRESTKLELNDKSELKNLIEDYENKIKNNNVKELSEISNKINEALFHEYLITIKTKTEDKTNFLHIKINEKDERYLIPTFTDEYEYIIGTKFITPKKGIKIEPYITNIDEFIEIAENDKNLCGLVVNPHSQNFIIETKSLIKYNNQK